MEYSGVAEIARDRITPEPRHIACHLCDSCHFLRPDHAARAVALQELKRLYLDVLLGSIAQLRRAYYTQKHMPKGALERWKSARRHRLPVDSPSTRVWVLTPLSARSQPTIEEKERRGAHVHTGNKKRGLFAPPSMHRQPTNANTQPARQTTNCRSVTHIHISEPRLYAVSCLGWVPVRCLASWLPPACLVSSSYPSWAAQRWAPLARACRAPPPVARRRSARRSDTACAAR